jgi:hypothetical protein
MLGIVLVVMSDDEDVSMVKMYIEYGVTPGYWLVNRVSYQWRGSHQLTGFFFKKRILFFVAFESFNLYLKILLADKEKKDVVACSSGCVFISAIS